jgi:NADH dehydrogenase
MGRQPQDRPDGLTEVEFVVGDVRDDASVRAATQGVEAVVCLAHGLLEPGRRSVEQVDVDGNARLADACARSGARFVMMSVLSTSTTKGPAFFRAKNRAEQRVRNILPDATVVRAPAFVETWRLITRDTRDRSGRPLVLGRGQNPVNMISVRDVADIIVELLAREASTATIGIEGPENVTMSDFADRVQRADGIPAVARHLPVGALRLMALQPVLPVRARLAELALAMERDPMASDLSRPPADRRGTTSIDDALAAAA